MARRASRESTRPLGSAPQQDIITKVVVTVTEDSTVDEVVELMLKHNINRIPVVTDGKPVGIVARHDLLRMLYKP